MPSVVGPPRTRLGGEDQQDRPQHRRPRASPRVPDRQKAKRPRQIPVKRSPFTWPLGDHLTEDQKSQLRELLDEHIDIFAFNMNDMGQVKNETFRIPITDDTPIFRRQYRLAEAEKEILKEQVEERLEAGFIRPSMSDYRALNKVNVTDHYQLPTPEEIFDAIQGSTWFTTLDMRWDYHQVKIAEEDCCKTAFWGPDGLFEWVVMPFGLKNAPAFFQCIMDSTLRTCRDFARCYIDDIIVHSQSFKDHLVHLRRTFGQIREKGIKLHPQKMKLAMPSVSYLGHEIVPNGTATDEAKVEAIKLMPPPKDDTELRAFLGSANDYRWFIRGFLC
jgi:hypothetical protein